MFFRSNDSVFINFLDNYLLPFEKFLKFFLLKLKKQNLKIQKNHHGFRRYKDEIEIVMKKNKLKIISRKKEMFEAV